MDYIFADAAVPLRPLAYIYIRSCGLCVDLCIYMPGGEVIEGLTLDPVALGMDTSQHDYFCKQTELVVVLFFGEGGWLICNACKNQ